MPAGEAGVVVDLRLRLRVLCFSEALPFGILPATMDNLVQDIAILFLYSVFTPHVSIVVRFTLLRIRAFLDHTRVTRSNLCCIIHSCELLTD